MGIQEKVQVSSSVTALTCCVPERVPRGI